MIRNNYVTEGTLNMKYIHAAKFGRRALRIAILALMLLCTATAIAEVKSAVITTDSRIFRSPSTSAPSLPVPGGMPVNLHAVSGDWALVENGGVFAYMYAGHIAEVAQPDVIQSTPVYIAVDTYVYQSASTSSASIPVCAGMKVSLLRISGDWALVENGGVRAYIRAAEISESAPAPEPDYSKLMANAKPAVITATCRVYQSPSTSAASTLAPAGMKVNLLTVSGDWALIENNGVFAYIASSNVKESAGTTTTAPETDDSALMANAKEAVITVSCRVYQSPSASAASVPAPAGMKVNLLAVNGDWTLIENNGVFAYIASGNVALAESIQPTPTPEPEQPDYSALLANAKEAVISADTLAYKFADLTSSSAAVSKGTPVRLLAVSDGWALIENNGSYGFINADHVAVSAQPTPTPAPVEDDYFSSSSYSNEQKCYIFMTREMGLNTAAASGILANIKRESSFNPASGGSYYGLCQWGGGRLTNLKNYCSANGYSASSLEGQLRFMWHELKNSYPSVYQTLQTVENTSDGAYTAGYKFCYSYEAPANRVSSSESRGALARDTYFPRYS